MDIRRSIRTLCKRFTRSFGVELTSYPAPHSQLEIIRQQILKQSVDAVFDIGAHEGLFGMLVREAGFRGPIYSFDPVSNPFLESRTQRDPSWKLFRHALGPEKTVRSLNVPKWPSFSSFLPFTDYGQNEFLEYSQLTRPQAVEVHRLDQIMDRLSVQDHWHAPLVKIDTQGFDFEVLAGAGTWLERIRVLQLEFSIQSLYVGAPGLVESYQRAEKLGFELCGIFPVAFDKHQRLVEVDCVFQRK